MRVGLSARLDHEDPGLPAELLDGHLAGCPACVGWLAGAERVTRAFRLRSVAVPDLTEPILAAVIADRRAEPGAAHARRQILRVAVGAAALIQLILAVQTLVGAGVAGGALHASREMASFDVALAVGFALVAVRPARARAFLPVAFVLAACLAITSGVDLAASTTVLAHEVGHLFVVVQAGLLWALGRDTAEPPARPAPVAG